MKLVQLTDDTFVNTDLIERVKYEYRELFKTFRSQGMETRKSEGQDLIVTIFFSGGHKMVSANCVQADMWIEKLGINIPETPPLSPTSTNPVGEEDGDPRGA